MKLVQLAAKLPKSIKTPLRPIYNFIYRPNKYHAEFSYWNSRFESDGGHLKNSHYRKLMLALADEIDETFLGGKIIADFGCGPCGSLTWVSSAKVKIGIDVLADVYADNFKNDIISHGMIYVKSTEQVIPLPSNYIDVLFSLNAMDHVDNFEDICREIIRIIRPGGKLICSFNLNEPPTAYEPQNLTEDIIEKNLLSYLEIESYRIAKVRPGDRYGLMLECDMNYKKGDRSIKPKKET